MALVLQGYRLTVSLVDNGGNVSNKVFALTAADETEAATAASGLMSSLTAITDAVVKSYSIGKVYVEDALTLPGVGVQVENIANIIVQLASSPLKRASIMVPAPKAAIFMGTSGPAANIVDVTNGGVTGLVARFYETTGVATLSDGEYAVGDPVGGTRIHRASRRG